MFPAMYLFTHEVISSYFLLASSFVSLTRNWQTGRTEQERQTDWTEHESRQTDIQTDIQNRAREADSQTDRQTDRQTGRPEEERQMDWTEHESRQTDRQTERHTKQSKRGRQSE